MDDSLSVEGVDDVINDVELGRQCTEALVAGDKARLKRLLVERVFEGVTWSTKLYAREWNRRWPKDPFDGT